MHRSYFVLAVCHTYNKSSNSLSFLLNSVSDIIEIQTGFGYQPTFKRHSCTTGAAESYCGYPVVVTSSIATTNALAGVFVDIYCMCSLSMLLQVLAWGKCPDVACASRDLGDGMSILAQAAEAQVRLDDLARPGDEPLLPPELVTGDSSRKAAISTL